MKMGSQRSGQLADLAELAMGNPYEPEVIAARRRFEAEDRWPRDARGWQSWWERLPDGQRSDDAAVIACFLGSGTEGGIRKAQPDVERRVRNLHHDRTLTDTCAEVAARALRIRAALDGIVGDTDVMREVRKACWAAAFGERVDAASHMSRLIQTTPVLIEGATGTGKELVARALCLSMPGTWKREGSWAPPPTDAVHLASLPDTLVESALFGHEKGAYSGADAEREGVLARCHGGVVFLDEIAELPKRTQVSLLRTLQEGKARRLGADADCEAAPRIVSATHRNLEQMVLEDGFRLDLLYRLSSVVIRLPSLAERRSDIPLLVEKEAEAAAPAIRIEIRDRFDRFMAGRPDYPWPGNVRELYAVVRTLALGLEPPMRQIAVQHERRVSMPREIADGEASLRDAQRWYCRRVLDVKDGTQREAARVLRIDRATLRKHLAGSRDGA